MSAGQAVARESEERLEEILSADPQALNRTDGFGTPLRGAVIWGRTSIVLRLLELGADVHTRNRDGNSALDLALSQAGSGRTYPPIVHQERRMEIERECARIARMLGDDVAPLAAAPVSR